MELKNTLISDDFKLFIISILKRINISNDEIKFFINEKNIKLFRMAFIDKSYDSVNNWEVFEYRGDKIINCCSEQYFIDRFPQVNVIHIIKMFTDYLKGKKGLSLIAQNHKFYKFMLINNDNVKHLLKTNKFENYELKSKLEDMVEALFGVIMVVCTKKYKIGVEYNICYQLLKSYYDELPLPLFNPSILQKPQTRLKENIFDKMGWNWKKSTNIKTPGATFISYYDKNRNKRVMQIYAYVKGDQTQKDKNKELIRYIVGDEDFKEDLEDQVMIDSINQLRYKYNIRENKRFEFYYLTPKLQNINFSLPLCIENIPHCVSQYISHFMENSGMNKDIIEKYITTNINQPDIVQSLIVQLTSKKEDNPGYNNTVYKYTGNEVIDLFKGEYVFRNKNKFGEFKEEKYYNNIGDKYSEILKNRMGLYLSTKYKIFDCVIFDNLIIESFDNNYKNSKNYKKGINSVYISLIGCLFSIINYECGRGVGYNVIYNLLSSHLEDYEYFCKNNSTSDLCIDTLDPTKLRELDPVTRLKELYDNRKLNWNYKECIFQEEYITNNINFLDMVYNVSNNNSDILSLDKWITIPVNVPILKPTDNINNIKYNNLYLEKYDENKEYTDEDKGYKIHVCKIYGYPLGNMKPIDKNKKIMTIEYSNIKNDAKHKACERVLKMMKNIYGITQESLKK